MNTKTSSPRSNIDTFVDALHSRLYDALRGSIRDLEKERATRRATLVEIFERHPDPSPEREAAVERVLEQMMLAIIQQIEAAMQIKKPH